MKNKTLWLGIVLGAFVRLSSAEASVAYCVAKGYVQLEYVTSDWIEGSIGEEKVGLAYYQTFIYGEIKGEQVVLNLKGNRVTGQVGKFNVRWYTDGKYIFGYQPCLFVVDEKP